jgi:membrane protease YdiL (CAAX protease family)
MSLPAAAVEPVTIAPRSPFDRLRARGLLAQMFLATIAVVLLVRLTGAGRRVGDPRVVALLLFLAVALVVIVRGSQAGIVWARLFGPPPSRDAWPLLLVVVPLALLMHAGFYLLYLPLSFVAPTFVRVYALQAPDFYDIQTVGQWVVLMVVAVAVAPVLEETLFRGLLMQRWAHRWGTRTGVVASSVLFALGHQELLGHFLFGAAMCLLYLRTRRLWVPIAAHAINNFVLLLPGLWGVLHHVPDHPETLATFRADWPSAVATLGIGLALLALYLRWYWPAGSVRAALSGRGPYEV